MMIRNVRPPPPTPAPPMPYIVEKKLSTDYTLVADYSTDSGIQWGIRDPGGVVVQITPQDAQALMLAEAAGAR